MEIFSNSSIIIRKPLKPCIATSSSTTSRLRANMIGTITRIIMWRGIIVHSYTHHYVDSSGKQSTYTTYVVIKLKYCSKLFMIKFSYRLRHITKSEISAIKLNGKYLELALTFFNFYKKIFMTKPDFPKLLTTTIG
jgi:hypothetical protein